MSKQLGTSLNKSRLETYNQLLAIHSSGYRKPPACGILRFSFLSFSHQNHKQAACDTLNLAPLGSSSIALIFFIKQLRRTVGSIYIVGLDFSPVKMELKKEIRRIETYILHWFGNFSFAFSPLLIMVCLKKNWAEAQFNICFVPMELNQMFFYRGLKPTATKSIVPTELSFSPKKETNQTIYPIEI